MTELTAANEEVRVRVAAGTVSGTRPGEVPLEALRNLSLVRTARFDEARLEIVIAFERQRTEAEAVIAQALRVLLDREVKISGVTKGRGLEQRVMDLT